METEHAVTAEAAGLWRRFGGMFVDAVVVGIVGAIIRVVAGLSLGELLSIAFGAGYFTYFHGSTGRTPGNAALGIRVVDIETGGGIGYNRALARWAMSIVSALALLLGYLWMLWDRDRQTWHDKLARSLPIVERR